MSPHPSSENVRRGVEREEFEIVENSPLENIDDVVQECISRVGLIIEPEPIYHAIRIQYLFGGKEHPLDPKSQDQIHREEQLYLKVIEGLRSLSVGGEVSEGDEKGNTEGSVESGAKDLGEGVSEDVRDIDGWFNSQGWVWPELYLDKNKNFPAHFTIQMHRNGRFIIPLKRGLNLKEFWYECSVIFSKFLSEEELSEFFSLLLLVKRCDDGNYRYMKYDDGRYIHLAHKINPDARIDELGLNKAKVILHFINYEENPSVKVYIDKSGGNYEIEGEFETPEGKDLFDIIKRGSVVAGNLSTMKGQLDQVDHDLNRIHALQVSHYSSSTKTLQQVQTFLEEQKENGFHAHLDEQLKQYSELYLSELDEKAALIIKSQKELFEDNTLVLSNLLGSTQSLNENIGIVGNNIQNLAILTNNSTKIIDQSIQELASSSKEDTDLLLNGQTELTRNIEELGKSIQQQFNSLKSFLEEQLSSLRSDFRNNLYLVLRSIQELPGATIDELYNYLKSELSVSKRTLYNYLNTLRERDLVSSRKDHVHPKGRPSRRFSLSEKVKTIMRK